MFRKVYETVYLTSDEDSESESVNVKKVHVPELTDDESSDNEKEVKEEPKVNLRYGLTIEGVKVEMPVKPYPCQEAVMTAIINGCRTQQHCLLESPTGSGKTLALLCGALAWQTDFENKIMETAALDKKQKENSKGKHNEVPSPSKKTCQEAVGKTIDDNFDDMDGLDDLDWSDEGFTNDNAPPKIPKIYYGSRTHRQITQVIKELRRTCYRHKRMTVLSSRDFSCIQDTDRDKTQLCNELLDPSKKCGCPYYTEDNKYSISTSARLEAYGIETPWDIEDLVEAGREAKACPYFAARSLMAEADIIFCPYNYIIDPAIRESMQISLHGSIIILDEAHNIEDICRKCASLSLPIDDLESIMKDCESVHQIAIGKKQIQEVAYAGVIENFAQDLLNFITTRQLMQQRNSDNMSSEQWTGAELVTLFEINDSITSTKLMNFMRAAREAINMYQMAKELMRTGRPQPPTLCHDVVRKVEKILMAFKMITSPTYASDYRAIVKQTPNGYKKERSLEFMCMNPGVIFAPICEMARTVVLASGTLAPTSSYQGELGVKFPYMIQANHVTPQEQVCIKCVGKGPAGTILRATYQNVNTWGFQDDLGGVLLTACEAVPHGILMFFSSYSVMGRLLERWKSNGIWEKLSRIKKIFQETRGSSDLSSMMDTYRKAIENTSDGPIGTITGALLFAVFRGKVAEGIDFSDNEARCVLTVGIPYAVRNDPDTDMKYQYNDLNRKKGLLSGNEWYTIQAFRALNQALGRAIRHQNDWGAIILIDERFNEPRHINLLPAWVQSMWIRQTGMNTDLRQTLKCFVAKQIKRERGKIRQWSMDSS